MTLTSCPCSLRRVISAPANLTLPPNTIYRTSRVTGPMPTSDWWTSVAWTQPAYPIYPLPLALLRPPGECGMDIAVGEGQSLGNRLDFGGPSFGFFAVTEPLLRRMPGRIAGETRDVDGKRGFVLTLQTREQHIRRERATSNICTAQALNALAGVIYLSWLGRRGIVELAELMLQRTAYARARLQEIDGVELLHDQPVVREFAVRLSAQVQEVIARCRQEGVNPGYPLGNDYPEFRDGLVVAITEKRTKADIDRLAGVLAGAVAKRPGPVEVGA